MPWGMGTSAGRKRLTIPRLLIVGLGFVWLGFAWLGCGGETPVRPNLILVTASGVRTNLLSCYGGDADTGGGICALGRPGVRYRWAIAQSPDSASSAASLLTSRMPSEHRVTASAATFLRSHHDTLPELLVRGGYTTAAFIGEPALNRARKLDRGFSLFDDSAAADAFPRRDECP